MKFMLNSSSVKSACLDFIEKIDLGAKPIMTVEIKPFRKSRSNPQNAFYYGIVIPVIVDATGYSKDECHELLATMFLPVSTVTMNGFTVDIRTSTAKLSTVDFNNYLESISHFASSVLGCSIPLPNELRNVF